MSEERNYYLKKSSFQTGNISEPGKGLIFAMACACGIAVANIYYNQPMIGVITRSFPGELAPSLIPTATQLGYALGLLLLVPLGDLIERRRLIVSQFFVLALSLLFAAVASTGWILLGASLCIGFTASVTQQIIPAAASLVSDNRRGAVIGSVMSGLLTGMLLSRILAGFIATHYGWRTMFWFGIPLVLAGAASMALLLPLSRPATSMKYGLLLRSLLRLWSEEPRLRRATLTQGLLFAVFSAFWTILALHLEQPPFHLGADIAGLFGIIGVVGVLAAPIAGRLADRRGPGRVVSTGAFAALLAWLVLAGWNSLTGLIFGVILLDFGMQSAMVANQQIIYGLKPQARNRVNSLFMVGMFIGGSLGSGGAMLAWKVADWQGVAISAIAVALTAFLAPLLLQHNRS
ncbi:MFS transporter [Methanosarcina sp.]|uniref:MFS transporter n=2 Tax=Methanosarcina sp. TaxID=2213 RepID=UPI0029892807|nr:MFS transporter [Methanosarcina sp.]MDW5550209.1 MFS transporter [Methanosarcina sp.]MDW5560586.1 MFS transporter [Methanosarcina sp.]